MATSPPAIRTEGTALGSLTDDTEYGTERSFRDEAGEIEGDDEVVTPKPPLEPRCRVQCCPLSSDPDPIAPMQARNLLLLALSYTFVQSSTILIVGGSAVAVISVGGGSDIAPIGLSSFFAGSSLVSLATRRLFDGLGRKGGFVVGSVLGALGGAVGAAAVALSSPPLVVASAFPVGCSNGIGLHLRFAAMEVAVKAKSLAMTLVLSGGCLAAFLGPESQALTRYAFGKDLEYLGVFVMIAVFNVISAALVSMVQFPSTEDNRMSASHRISEDNDSEAPPGTVHEREFVSNEQQTSITALLRRFDFFSSAALASLSWSIMAMPMSILRVAMNEVGYSARLSLTTLELHFLGMFAPGFVTGGLIRRFGVSAMRWAGLVLFVTALVTNLLSRPEADGGTVGSWMAGFALLGIGWNVVFSSATVMLSETYAADPTKATRIQAANDFLMFGVSGALVVFTGYIFQAGGSGLEGWVLLNSVALGFVLFMIAVLVALTWQSYQAAKSRVLESVELTGVVDSSET